MRRERRRTLELVAELNQTQLDWTPGGKRWSVGEALDHLIQSDIMFRDEIRELLAKGSGRGAFLFRGLPVMGGPFTMVPVPFLWPLEVPVFLWNVAVPQSLRRWLVETRTIPAKAPESLKPRRARPVAALREDLEAALGELDKIQHEHEEEDLKCFYYYSPLLGLVNVPGMVLTQVKHDLRHQGQIREIKKSAMFPKAEK